jgi:hypothetical protein
MIDLSVMKEIARESFVAMVARNHGTPGIDALNLVLEFVQRFYQRTAPESRISGVLIFKHLGDVPLLNTTPGTVQYGSLANLPPLSLDPVIIQIFASGDFSVLQGTPLDPQTVAADGVAYTLDHTGEQFYAKAESARVKNPAVGYLSIFALPTFSRLKDALEEYRVTQVRKCSCPTLEKAWQGSKRIVFRHSPEAIMRDSLTQFLKISLRGDVEVRPEQIVDKSHPVDIKVTWFLFKRLALIEIKWLGASKSKKSGKLTRYADHRAREGAQQLADYMDGNATQAPTHEARGYLVVIDGRRGGVKPSTKQISSAQGFKYQNSAIHFDPEHHKIRKDFEVPFRMFIEPVCQ